MEPETIINEPYYPTFIIPGIKQVIILSIALTALAAAMETSVSAAGKGFDNSKYAIVLNKYVDDKGMVDYKALKANREELDRYNESIAAIDPQDFAKWSDQEKIALLINAYNSLTLKAIINNYPIKKSLFNPSAYIYPSNSIRQISGVWDETTHEVMGKEMTLDHIEHEILRKDFNEPRIHMALVCAAMGCPILRNEPYTGEKLEEQLEDQSRRFMNNPAKFRIDKESSVVYLSSIFKWFGSDFVKKYPVKNQFKGPNETVSSVLKFASSYLTDDDANYLKEGDYSIEYLDYDWSLNEQN